MRAFPTFVGLIPAFFLLGMAVTATPAAAQHPATFTCDTPPLLARTLLGLSGLAALPHCRERHTRECAAAGPGRRRAGRESQRPIVTREPTTEGRPGAKDTGPPIAKTPRPLTGVPRREPVPGHVADLNAAGSLSI